MIHYNKILIILSIVLCFSSCENKKTTSIQSFTELDLKRVDPKWPTPFANYLQIHQEKGPMLAT